MDDAPGTLAIAAGGGCSGETRPPKKKAPEAARAPAAPAPAKPDVATATDVVDTTAGKLLAEYKANQIGADERYKGKVLRVLGLVERVGRGADDKPILVFHLAAKPDGLRARFASEAGLGGLKRMDEATARCLGGSDLGEPTLTECVIENPLPKSN